MNKNFTLLTAASLKKSLRMSGQRGLSLDIDETLSHTNRHWIEQLRVHYGIPEKLTTDEIIEKYRYIERVPHWQTEAAFAKMRELMDSNEFQKTIPLIQDANHMANKINALIPIVAYISARPVSVFRGTKTWLRQHGFPPAPVILRPPHATHEQKNMWKAEILEFLFPEIIGIIDDNPGLPEQLPKNYRGIVYLYDSVKKPETSIHVIPCKHWKDVAANTARDKREATRLLRTA